MKRLAEVLYEDCEGGKVWRSHSASRWSGGQRWHKETVRRSEQSRMDVQSKKSIEAWEMVTPVGCGSMEKGDMVCLCASHMNTLGRWERFMQMLTSWKEQTWELPLIVSMSFEESVEGVIKLPEMEGLTIIRQRRKTSQFEHYKVLAELDWGDETWVMFTDDDDLWHEARAEAYVTMLQECRKRGVRPAYVVSKTIVATEEDDPPGLETAEDVTVLFERGVISQEVFDKKDVGRMESGNYVEYGVSIQTLRGFLQGVHRELLEHKFCDLAFTRYLREGHDLPMCRLQPEGIPWLYFYRRDPGIGQVCVSLRSEAYSRGLQNNVELMCARTGGFSIERFEKERKGAGGTGSVPAVLYKRVWRHAQGAKALMQVPKLVM